MPACMQFAFQITRGCSAVADLKKLATACPGNSQQDLLQAAGNPRCAGCPRGFRVGICVACEEKSE